MKIQQNDEVIDAFYSIYLIHKRLHQNNIANIATCFCSNTHIPLQASQPIPTSVIVMMPPLDRLIRALSSSTRLASPGTNSAWSNSSSSRDDDFLLGALELQQLPGNTNTRSTFITSSAIDSRSASPPVVHSECDHAESSPFAAIDQSTTGFPGESALRFRHRAITRSDSFDSTSSAQSRSSSRSSRSTLSSYGDAVARSKRPTKSRRESQSCWREYWD